MIGIISCLAFNPSSEDLFAAGSYNKTTALYSEHNAELLFVLHGQEGGVTQVYKLRALNFRFYDFTWSTFVVSSKQMF